jgi:hypothetical protein
MIGRRRQLQGLLELLRTGQQRLRAAIVQVQILLQAQTGQQRRLPIVLRGEFAAIVRQLFACDLRSQVCKAE